MTNLYEQTVVLGQEATEKMDELVPYHLHEGLIRYFEDGIVPGSFMTAVLTNDLRNAVQRADHISIPHLQWIVNWLVWYAPSGAWGSITKVQQWAEQRSGHIRAKRARSLSAV